jgi:hypothetical protein
VLFDFSEAERNAARRALEIHVTDPFGQTLATSLPIVRPPSSNRCAFFTVSADSSPTLEIRGRRSAPLSSIEPTHSSSRE